MKRRRPRALTLTLPDAQQPHLLLEGKPYTLRNFSQEGLGLWVATPLPFGLHKGNQLRGDVVVENHIYPVELEVVHHSAKTVGLSITKMSEELRGLFQRLLEPATYGGTLEPHPDSGKVDEETGYQRLWFHGRGGSELVVWYNESSGMILALQLVWVGKWVSRHQFRPTETGHLCDDTRRRFGRVLREEEILSRDPRPEPELLQQAAQLLAALAPPYPGHLLWQFLETGEQVYLPPSLRAKVQVA